MNVEHQRYYELDWLRVLAFFLLILFHAGMAFNSWGWHIKNTEQSEWLTDLMYFPHQWRIPLLYLISGAGIWFSLNSRGIVRFIKERATRLLLPLIFGILVVVPPQIYMQRLTEGMTLSYWQFYPRFFDGIYPEGNFSWHHLWFVVYLVASIMVLLPLFSWIRKQNSQGRLNLLYRITCHPYGIHLFAVPIVAADWFLAPIFPPTDQYLIGDWTRFSVLTMILLIGFLFCSNQKYWRVLLDFRRTFLVTGIGLFAIRYLVLFNILEIPGSGLIHYLYDFINVGSSWMIILAILGYGRRYLTFSNRFLTYCNEAVYPFYILHQTVTLVAVYFMVPLTWHWFTKFALVTVSTVVVTWGIYHYLIRPYNLTRFVFGLKLRKSESKLPKKVCET